MAWMQKRDRNPWTSGSPVLRHVSMDSSAAPSCGRWGGSAARSSIASPRDACIECTAGVYAVGHPLLGPNGAFMAAVLGVPGGVLSHRSVAALWGIRRTSRAVVDVTTPRKAHPRPGIAVHRVRYLPAEDVTSTSGIPCTTVARTILDLAGTLDAKALERAIDQAEYLRIFDLRALEATMSRAGRRPGLSLLHALLTQPHFAQETTRSELENRFLELCARANLPTPRVNAWVALDGSDGAGHEVDFLWSDQRLIVETDGHRAHGTRLAFERDRRRDQDLLLAGWRVVRFTWRQVSGDPAGVAARVRTLLDVGPRRVSDRR
jgi:hypothetical protein